MAIVPLAHLPFLVYRRAARSESVHFCGMIALSDDEIVQRGIAQATTDRMIELRQRAAQLAAQPGSLKKLSERVDHGFSPDDHTQRASGLAKEPGLSPLHTVNEIGSPVRVVYEEKRE